MMADDGSALVNAASWIAALLTGPVATGLGVLAVAGIGFGLLSGHITFRRGVETVVGLFILVRITRNSPEPKRSGRYRIGA
jgi:type IV secretory pathway VirB2 component (pilin)